MGEEEEKEEEKQELEEGQRPLESRAGGEGQ